MIPEVLIIMVVVISILIKKLVLIIISIVFSGCNETFVFSECGELGLHMAYIYSRATGLNYEGPALGVNFRCCLPDTSLGNKILNGLNLMAEYDARTINIGFNYAVWKDRFNLIAELNDGKYLSAGLYFKICLK